MPLFICTSINITSYWNPSRVFGFRAQLSLVSVSCMYCQGFVFLVYVSIVAVADVDDAVVITRESKVHNFANINQSENHLDMEWHYLKNVTENTRTKRGGKKEQLVGLML